MTLFERVKELFDYAGGSTDTPPPWLPIGPASWMWAVWWAALSLLIIVFCGQATKFIYIDF